MLTMGIDQSFTSTGLVILDGKNLIHYEVIHSSKDREIVGRLQQIYQRILKLTIHFKPDHIIIEGLGFGARGNATRDLGGLFYCIQDRLIHDLNFDSIHTVAPTSLKKFATNFGKASKQQMLEALPEDISMVFTHHYKKTKGLMDLVDGYWLAEWGQQHLHF